LRVIVAGPHQLALEPDEPAGVEAARVGLAYRLGWGLLTQTRFGPAFFKEGHGDGAQNYMVCFERRQACTWEGYTLSYIERSRKP
jgi:hypothetical protein